MIPCVLSGAVKKRYMEWQCCWQTDTSYRSGTSTWPTWSICSPTAGTFTSGPDNSSKHKYPLWDTSLGHLHGPPGVSLRQRVRSLQVQVVSLSTTTLSGTSTWFTWSICSPTAGMFTSGPDGISKHFRKTVFAPAPISYNFSFNISVTGFLVSFSLFDTVAK